MLLFISNNRYLCVIYLGKILLKFFNMIKVSKRKLFLTMNLKDKEIAQLNKYQNKVEVTWVVDE